MNLLLFELKSHAKSWVIWAVSLAAFIFMMFTEFSAYYDNPEMADILNSMPPALLEAFGMGGVNLTTLSGFVSIAYVYLLLMVSIYAILLGSGIVSKEERDKTTEFLMVLPVTRTFVLLYKSIAALILNSALCGVVALSITLSSLPYEKDTYFMGFFTRMMLVIVLVSTTFLFMGMALSALIKHHKYPGLISVAIVTVMYLLSIISGLSDSVSFLKTFSFFKYFEGQTLILENTLETLPILVLLVTLVSALALIFYRYPRRDLNV